MDQVLPAQSPIFTLLPDTQSHSSSLSPAPSPRQQRVGAETFAGQPVGVMAVEQVPPATPGWLSARISTTAGLAPEAAASQGQLWTQTWAIVSPGLLAAAP